MRRLRNICGSPSVCIGEMALIGRLHPLLVHFPIGLVLMAAVAEVVAMVTGLSDWRTVALTNVRAGAVFAIGAAIAGWRLASSPGIEATSSLEWHRWLGALAAIAVFGAALATAGARGRSPSAMWVYRITLFWAALLVAVTGHLGGLLVWGADFLRP
jgi:uncharacterized membrane protein